MTKAEILKQTGLTEEEFYKKFPTKESFQKFIASQNQMNDGGPTLTDAQMTGIQAGAQMINTGAQALKEIKGPDNRPSIAAQTGGGALAGLASGASTGAAIGAAIGTAIPIPILGTVAGGLGGAIIGGTAGLIGGTAMGANRGRNQLDSYQEGLAMDRMRDLGRERMDAMMGSTPGINMPGYGAGQMRNGGPTNKTQVEIEGNELLQFNQGGLATVMGGPGELNELSSGVMKADGPSHEGGGIPINTDSGRVFSDVVPKGEKQSPAQKAEEVSKELQKYEERAKKGGFAQKTYEFMKKQLEGKLDDIYNAQEALKAETGEIPTNEMRMGGELPKYPNGGEFGDPTLMGYEAGNTLSPEMAQAAYLRQLANQSVPVPEYTYNSMTPAEILGSDDLRLLQGHYAINDIEEDVKLEEELGPEDKLLQASQLPVSETGELLNFTSPYLTGGQAAKTQSLISRDKDKEDANELLTGTVGTVVGNTAQKEQPLIKRKKEKEDEKDEKDEESTVGQYDEIIKQAQMYNLFGALPSMGYNLGKGLFGKADRLDLDRTDYQNFKAMKDLAGRTDVYNPAAELAAIQGSTGRAAYDIASKTGGDLGAYMRARVALADQEGKAKGSILGAAEKQNLQAQDLKNQRLLSILQAEGQDRQGVDMFNIGQREKELQYNKAAQSAQNQYMNAFYSQLGALGKGLGTTELYKAQLEALTKKK